MLVQIKNNLKSILDKKGMTAYKLAQEWNKHSNHVYRMVKRDVWPEDTRLKTFLELAEILEVEPQELFERVD